MRAPGDAQEGMIKSANMPMDLILLLRIFFGLPLSMKAKIPFMIAIIQNIRRMSSAESLLSKHA
ncbi:hypothetical protein AO842_25255 [Klebsiella sp. AA405]|nr:hypothetical protein AO842_25255 [Klebsiella sp. AA405]ODM37522.1 hypothetical protein ACT15_15945 [Klebsiella pneumoniae]